MTAIEVLVDEVCLDIRESALEAANARRQCARDSEQFHFESGQVAAYQRMITLIQQMADALKIDRKTVHLDGLDPDNDLT